MTRIPTAMHFKIKTILISLFLLGFVSGQTITFSVYVESELSATNEQDFMFGSLNPGDGIISINLGDGTMGIISIFGNGDLDVIVTLDSPTQLTHTGSSTDVMPFTMNFAYANHNVNDWTTATLVSSGNTARFKIRERDIGPASAPPDPSIRKNSGSPISANATAYIYFYGNCTVGSIDSGSYTGTITLSVNYD